MASISRGRFGSSRDQVALLIIDMEKVQLLVFKDLILEIVIDKIVLCPLQEPAGVISGRPVMGKCIQMLDLPGQCCRTSCGILTGMLRIKLKEAAQNNKPEDAVVCQDCGSYDKDGDEGDLFSQGQNTSSFIPEKSLSIIIQPLYIQKKARPGRMSPWSCPTDNQVLDIPDGGMFLAVFLRVPVIVSLFITGFLLCWFHNIWRHVSSCFVP